MFDLCNSTYEEVNKFLAQNFKRIDKKPCIEYTFLPNKDLYELIIITMEDKYFDEIYCKNNDYCIHNDNYYYYILNYNDESYLNELSVIDCGGYYIAACIFKNKINITNELIYNKNSSRNIDYFTKFHMNTVISSK